MPYSQSTGWDSITIIRFLLLSRHSISINPKQSSANTDITLNKIFELTLLLRKMKSCVAALGEPVCSLIGIDLDMSGKLGNPEYFLA